MTREHLYHTLVFYDLHLEGLGINEVKNGLALQHLCWMCGMAVQFWHEDRIEKAMRWLGFIQGTLWMFNVFSIEELKEHSRTPKEEVVSGKTC